MTHARVGDQLHTLEAVQALPAGAVIVWHERDTSDTRAGVICRSLDRDGRIYSELEHTAPPHWIRGLDNGEVLHTQILQLPATLVHLPRQTLSRTIDPAALVSESQAPSSQRRPPVTDSDNDNEERMIHHNRRLADMVMDMKESLDEAAPVLQGLLPPSQDLASAQVAAQHNAAAADFIEKMHQGLDQLAAYSAQMPTSKATPEAK